QGLCGAVEERILCALKGRESEILNSKPKLGLRLAVCRFRACDGAGVLLEGERRGMVSLTRGLRSDMSQIGKFTQPDTSPAYFIEFLEFLDKREEIRQVRAQAAKGLNLAAGHKVLDLGCGIGGATFPLAEITGPTGLAAGVDISAAMVEA